LQRGAQNQYHTDMIVIDIDIDWELAFPTVFFSPATISTKDLKAQIMRNCETAKLRK